MVFGKEVVQYQDKLYYIYRKLKPDSVKEKRLDDLKSLWMCDVVVRNKYNNDDTLLFLRLIEDAEIIEDNIN